MTVATNRPDGWPQATTVGYVNDGLTIYFLCSPQSQKAASFARDSRISLTTDHDVSDPMAITGLSMAAQTQTVTDPTEVAKSHESASDEIPRMRRSRCQNRRNRGLPCASNGYFLISSRCSPEWPSTANYPASEHSTLLVAPLNVITVSILPTHPDGVGKE